MNKNNTNNILTCLLILASSIANTLHGVGAADTDSAITVLHKLTAQLVGPAASTYGSGTTGFKNLVSALETSVAAERTTAADSIAATKAAADRAAAAATAAQNSLSTQLRSLNAENSALKKTIADSADKIGELEKKVDYWNTEFAKQRTIAEKFEREAESQKQEATAQLEARTQEQTAYKQAQAKKLAEHEETKDELETWKSKLMEERAARINESKELTNRVLTTDAENTRFQARIGTLTKDLAEEKAEVDALNTENATLKSQSAEAASSVESLRLSRASNADLRAQLGAMRTENEQLTPFKGLNTVLTKDLVKAKSELEGAKTDNERLKAQVEKAAAMESALTKSQTATEQLKAKIARLTSKAQEVKTEFDAVATFIDKGNCTKPALSAAQIAKTKTSTALEALLEQLKSKYVAVST